MAISLQEARDKLQLWLDAEEAIACGQSYRIGTRSVTRADLSEVSNRIQYWSNQVARLERGNRGSMRVQRVRIIDQ